MAEGMVLTHRLHRTDPKLLADRIDGVRSKRHQDTGRTPHILLKHVEGGLDTLLAYVVDQRDAHATTDPHAVQYLPGLLRVPIHIIEKDRTRLDHLQHGQLATDTDIVRRHLRLERPNVLIEPREELHVVGIAAQERHGRMRVHIVERRHDRHVLHQVRMEDLIPGFRLDIPADAREHTMLHPHIDILAIQQYMADV